MIYCRGVGEVPLESRVWKPCIGQRVSQADECCLHDLPFPTQSDLDPIALLVSLLLYLRGECDGAHDTVPELLIDDSLVCVAVVLDNLEQSVDQGLLWWQIESPTSIG